MSGDYLGLRTVLESPILDDHKWAKVPQIPSDAILVDMEDSVPPERKAAARDKVTATIADPGPLAGRVLIPRVNSIQTPWGIDDLKALAAVGTPRLAYPKVESRVELDEVLAILRTQGVTPDLFLVIESARGILELEQLASAPQVAAMLFGPYDLAVSARYTLFDGDDLFEPALYYPRSKLALAAAAFGLACFDMMFVSDMRDAAAVKARATFSKKLGFTGVATFYPPHVDIVNEVYTPSTEEIVEAERIVEVYESALSGGQAATSRDGHALIVQDYKKAQLVLDRARQAGQ